MVGLAVAADGLLRWQKKGVVFEGGGSDGKLYNMHTYIHTYILKTVHTFYDLIFATYISRGKFFAAYIHTYINAWTCNYSIHYIHSFRRRWCEQEARGELAGRVVQNVLRRLGYINVFVIRTYMHTYIHTSHTLFAH